MKKILIAYSSKTGTAAECAGRLAAELKGPEVTVADLDREQPDPSDFDVAVVGGSVRFGAVRKQTVAFIRANEQKLSRMPHAFFLCCGMGHTFEEYIEQAFPKELRETAFAVLNFGGTLKLEKANIAEKILLHFIRSSIRESEIEDGEYTPALPSVLPENISMLASALRREL